MKDALTSCPATLEELRQALHPLRESILADLVMLAQIAAPTGQEEPRVRFLLDRFVECGLPEAGTDEIGNAVGLLPGKTGNRTIMLVAHLDSISRAGIDHNVSVASDRILGPGVGDNALGGAAVSMIPACLEHLGIELDANLLLAGTVQSLGRANHEGLRFHLDHSTRPVDIGICVEGITLGRLNYFSIGTLRGDITCDVRPEHHSRSYGSESALVVLNHIINRILAIEIPKRPYTVVRIGKIRAGVAYDIEPDHAELGFEVVSHSDAMIERIRKEFEDLVAEMSSRHAVDANLEFISSVQAGGIPFSHPLVKTTVDVMTGLDIAPDQGHSPSELSEFIARGIPAITLGITTGEKNLKQPDYVMIEPILTGLAQLIGVIQAIDRGDCDEQ